jgi:hypothetical protein
MIVKIIEHPRKRYNTLIKKVLVMRCDECYNLFSTNYTFRRCQNANHFCSYACQKRSQQPGGAFAKHLAATFIQNLGVINPSQLEDHRTKTEVTCLSKYGTTCGLTTPWARAKALSVDSICKAHATRKKNGMLKTSGPETQFYHLLVERLGFAEVERWRTINGWSIDFYLKTNNIYIQFDGVFWHGLDRPIAEIRQSLRPVDQQIVRKWETDRAQENWFDVQRLCLVRVTDVELKQQGSNVVDIALNRAAIWKGNI